MRIGIQTWGSEGDIRPFVALAAGLAKAGHDVELVVTELADRDYLHYAEPLGIRVRMVASPVVASVEEMRDIGETLLAMADPYRQGRYIERRLFAPIVEPLYAAAAELAQSNDAIVRHFFHHPAAAAADAAGIPDISVCFSPDAIPSPNQPPGYLPDLGRWGNTALWSLGLWLLDRAFLPNANQLRSKLGLAPLARITDAWYSRRLNLLAASPALQPAGIEGWDARHRMTGFLELPQADRFDPPPATLMQFLADGTPPMFFGFGSLTPQDATLREETLDVVRSTLQLTGQRAVVQGLCEAGTSEPGTMHVGRLANAGIYPHCAAVVHHAGAGTTQTALAAGVPSVPVPHLADQFYWSAQLQRLGVAPKPLPRTKLTAARLAKRIERVIDAPNMRARAAEIGRAMATEDGVAMAVRHIEDALRAPG